MVLTTAQLRSEYGADCREREAAGAQEAWDAVSAVMLHYGYHLRQGDTGSRSCRAITGGKLKSLHAAFLKVRILLWNLAIRIAGGVACDFNWETNPYGPRLVTDMPRAMIDAICAIRTNSGAQAFRWGGYYTGNKDAMHIELVCHKADLATGIDPNTSPQGSPPPTNAIPQEDDMPVIVVPTHPLVPDGERNQNFVCAAGARVQLPATEAGGVILLSWQSHPEVRTIEVKSNTEWDGWKALFPRLVRA
jgi:hypothetical protein